MLTEKERNALKYAGLLGHEFIVLRKDLTIEAECPTLERANINAEECGGSIYQQTERRKFKKIE